MNFPQCGSRAGRPAVQCETQTTADTPSVPRPEPQYRWFCLLLLLPLCSGLSPTAHYPTSKLIINDYSSEMVTPLPGTLVLCPLIDSLVKRPHRQSRLKYNVLHRNLTPHYRIFRRIYIFTFSHSLPISPRSAQYIIIVVKHPSLVGKDM